MATGGNEIASDEIPDFQCFTCSNKVAEKYCIECQAYCCQFCVDMHSRFPALKGHTLLDPSKSLTHGVSSKLPTMPTERCHIHTMKLVEMYCKDHDEVGCTTCMALNHRSCRDVHSIPDDIDVLYDATDVVNTNLDLKSNEKRFKNIEKKKEEALTGLNLSRKKADMTIDNAKQELIAYIENLAKQAKQEVEKSFQSTKAKTEKEKNEANKRMDDFKKMSADLKTSEGNKSQQFVCMKIAKRKIKEAEQVEQTLQYNEVSNITFDVESGIQAFSRDVKTFGRVSFTSETKRYTVDTIRDMNVKVQEDNSTCNIKGSCMLEDGRLLLVDYNNKKLKLVNIEAKNVDSVCTFENNPYCVCCTYKNEAVVTFYTNTKFIQFVSIGTQLSPSRKVNINHYCFGISYENDNLYITDAVQTLYIHDMTGNELQKISTDSSGNCLFSRVLDIVFSEYMRGSIVSDWYKGVIILNDQYQPIAGYCDAGLQVVSSVCTDGRGSIFVCGVNSHNVLQIGYDGKKICDVVDKSNGIQYPWSLCFDSSRCRLIVTQCGDIVKIIQLK